jgi:lipoprotein NlpD
MEITGLKRITVLSLLLVMTACGPGLYRWDAGEGDPREDRIYTVQRGDTLYSIAFRYGLDYRRLAEWNGIASSYLIHPGDTLKLLPPTGKATTSAYSRSAGSTVLNRTPATEPDVLPASSDIAWQWPYKGDLLAKFGDANGSGKGIDIEGIVGDPVIAAADGRVVYAGSGLVGYGKIIIIKHSEKVLSAYGHNSELFVREGEQVRQGQEIAALGRGPESRPLLHFEIRLNGKAVDPLRYLPRR